MSTTVATKSPDVAAAAAAPAAAPKKAAAKKEKQPKRPEHLRDLEITAWRVAAKQCGYLVKGKKKEEGGGFKHIPQVGTEEHAKIKARQQELIKEWEAADAIPEEFKSKRDPNAPPKKRRAPKKAVADDAAAANDAAVSTRAEVKLQCPGCKAVQLVVIDTTGIQKAEKPKRPRKKRRTDTTPADEEQKATPDNVNVTTAAAVEPSQSMSDE